MPRKKLGEVLVEHRWISQPELNSIITRQSKSGHRLGELLLDEKLVSREDLARALEEINQIPYLDCLKVQASPEALAQVPRSFALRHLVLPVSVEDRKLVVVMAEPQNLTILHELAFMTGMEVTPRQSFRSDIRAALHKWYGESEEEQEKKPPRSKAAAVQADEPDEGTEVYGIKFLSPSSSEGARAAMLEVQADLRHQGTPAVRLASRILVEAARRKASDIHIEPRPDGARVRLRVDGVLKEMMRVPANVQAALVSRIKILADLDIADRRAAQDGRFLVKMGSSRLDLRVSTLPTNYGEKVVIRLLDPRATQIGFRELGLSEQAETMLLLALRQPQGMVLVTGPTGSGKSTTLYAALNVLRSPGVNIVTVEDPIEYHIDDINQVQVNPKAGLPFAACLRALMRQDPNIIMVGEIRDPETAETAVQAAQTGHLVLSSVHTNDALATVARLTDLGLTRFQITSAMTLAIGQRLVRRFCECRVEGPPSSEEREAMAMLGLPPAELTFRPGGCPKCDGSGYRGRIGIYEVLNFDEQIRACLLRGASAEEVRALARAQGMSSMLEDAFARLHAGLTSATEVFRAVPIERTAAISCAECRNALAPVFVFCPYCGAAAPRPETIVQVSCA